MRPQNQIQVAEYICWASSVVGMLVAAVSERFIFAGLPISLSLLLNLINRRRVEIMAHRRAMAAVVRVHQQLSSDMQYLSDRLSDDRRDETLPSPFPLQPSSLSHPRLQQLDDLQAIYHEIVQLQAGYDNLHDTLAETIEYINTSPLPHRLDDLETRLDRLANELDRLKQDWQAAVPIEVTPTREVEFAETGAMSGDGVGEIVDASPTHDGRTDPAPTPHLRTLSLPLQARREPPPEPPEAVNAADLEEEGDRPPSPPVVPMFSISRRSPRSDGAAPTLPLQSPSSPEMEGEEDDLDPPDDIPTPVSPPISPRVRPPAAGDRPTARIGLPDFGRVGQDAEPEIEPPPQPWHCVNTLTDCHDWISALAISPDGTRLVAASFDKTVQLWRLPDGENLGTLSAHASPVCTIALAPDGSLLASGSWDKTVKLWDLNKLPESLADFDPATLLAGTLTDETEMAGSVRSLAISPDGRFIASGWFERSLQVWQVRVSPKRRRISTALCDRATAHGGRVDAVAFSPDGTRLASAGADGSIVLWHFDPDSGQFRRDRVITENASPINALSFSGDGTRLISASRDRALQIWNLETARLQVVLQGHAGSVTALARFPDGNTLASASSDGTVKLWDLARGQAIASFADGNDAIMAVAVSQDGNTLASGSADGTVKVWQPGDP